MKNKKITREEFDIMFDMMERTERKTHSNNNMLKTFLDDKVTKNQYIRHNDEIYNIFYNKNINLIEELIKKSLDEEKIEIRKWYTIRLNRCVGDDIICFINKVNKTKNTYNVEAFMYISNKNLETMVDDVLAGNVVDVEKNVCYIT